MQMSWLQKGEERSLGVMRKAALSIYCAKLVTCTIALNPHYKFRISYPHFIVGETDAQRG